jgi:hypothetical protein
MPAPARRLRGEICPAWAPHLTDTNGTFSFFCDDQPRSRRSPRRQVNRVSLKWPRYGSDRRPGQQPPESCHHRVDLTAYIDHDPAARFDHAKTGFLLKEGDGSEWVRSDFKLGPGLKSASGIFRVYLQKTHPNLAVYVSPVNLDPEDPALPISTPGAYSRKLASTLGPFYTQGIAEDTSAYRAGVLSRDEFLTQSRQVLADSLRMFRQELNRFSGGLLFYYFSSVDQNAHMLWGRYEPDLLEIYKAVDTAIGEAMQKAGADTGLMVISDHGFARFDRAVHLNTFLMQQGFLALYDPTSTGDAALFAHVDWTRSVAYAIGLNGIYVNLEGRENGGIVRAANKQMVLDQIAASLKTFTDPVSGEHVVDRVYFPETTFKGRNLRNSPDLFVGFRGGYRASWQTALGAVPSATLEDNTDAWIGDHCIASDEVPGVLLSNRKVRASAPQLFDITATILNKFGVAKTSTMIGQSVY